MVIPALSKSADTEKVDRVRFSAPPFVWKRGGTGKRTRPLSEGPKGHAGSAPAASVLYFGLLLECGDRVQDGDLIGCDLSVDIAAHGLNFGMQRVHVHAHLLAVLIVLFVTDRVGK